MPMTGFTRRNPHDAIHRKIVARSRRPGPLGVRLWLADVAAGIRLRRAGTGPSDRRPPRAVRLFLRPSRHAGEAGPGPRARSRRRLSRHRLPCRRRPARCHHRLSARPRADHQRLSRGDAIGVAERRSPQQHHGIDLCRQSRPRPVCRPARPARSVALRAAGPRPLRRQPQLCAVHRRLDPFARFALADRLGKTLDEIEAMPAGEFVYWTAYLSIVTPKGKR